MLRLAGRNECSFRDSAKTRMSEDGHPWHTVPPTPLEASRFSSDTGTMKRACSALLLLTTSASQLQSPPMTLSQKIANRSAVVGIVGLGYVGLPLARAFHDAGFKVLGFDIDESKIVAIEAG